MITKSGVSIIIFNQLGQIQEVRETLKKELSGGGEPDRAESDVETVPKELKECFNFLMQFNDVNAFLEEPEDNIIDFHHTVGRTLRNELKLWDNDSALSIWFKSIGAVNADDMSSIILTSYHRHLNKRPMKIGEQIKEIKAFYQNEN